MKAPPCRKTNEGPGHRKYLQIECNRSTLRPPDVEEAPQFFLATQTFRKRNPQTLPEPSQSTKGQGEKSHRKMRERIHLQEHSCRSEISLCSIHQGQQQQPDWPRPHH